MPNAAAPIAPRPIERWKDRAFLYGDVDRRDRDGVRRLHAVFFSQEPLFPNAIGAQAGAMVIAGTAIAIVSLRYNFSHGLAVFDLSTRGRVHPAYIWGGS